MLSLICAAWSGPAGQVTAAVWDQFGGMPVFRLLRDTAAALAPTPNGRAPCFRVADRARRDERNVALAGLVQVEQISLTIGMDFTGFDYY